MTARPGSGPRGLARSATRRHLLGLGVTGLAALLAACDVDRILGSTEMASDRVRRPGPRTADDGRLRARPGPPTNAGPVGMQPLGLADTRDGLLYVPTGYQPAQPAPLALMLHGAGGDAQGGLFPLIGLADAAGIILLAPESRGRTWDVIMGRYGPDVEFVDRALAQAFDRYAVDPAHLAVGGFSDGASYALSLGLTNGDLFSRVVAFSPGFLAPAVRRGRPRVFISHGLFDNVLPIDRCSRQIVPALERAGYEVDYHEFGGPHTVPPAIAAEAADWLAG
jgi:phospholipase/carboxylesterase